ncbi:glucosaminidase domain-containing protein [Fusobacterium massiliense]|uniref:glucosaminidase domain-containing protein n=1 Tax=Fusobacterium massiliense TaxID=1852365 RepID=UPI0028EFB7B5|nr:glucosaminidase domain-containing protein [Fusobacterium massiliense]
MKKYIIACIFLCLSFFSYAEETIVLDQDASTGMVTQAKDFEKIKGKSKKQIFIDTLIPAIEKVRDKITKDKEYVKELSKKVTLSQKEQEYVEEMFSKYNVKSKDLDELAHKMIVPPTAFILGQSSLESGWGSAKIAKEGNNLFAIRTILRDPEKTVQTGPNSFYKKYKSLEDSLMDYIMTLSRHTSYSNLRKAINKGETTLGLIQHLGNYSEVKGLYSKRLTQIITKNNLVQYDGE